VADADKLSLDVVSNRNLEEETCILKTSRFASLVELFPNYCLQIK
jgi:hypothetical protein